MYHGSHLTSERSASLPRRGARVPPVPLTGGVATWFRRGRVGVVAVVADKLFVGLSVRSIVSYYFFPPFALALFL